MIVAKNVTMTFDAPGRAPFVALQSLSCSIPKGCIYGMIGSNGAGKSTFLRLLSGVYAPRERGIEIDGEPVWENPTAKGRIVYIPDELYFLPQSNIREMAKLYRSLYPRFSNERLYELTAAFHLDERANIQTFSKGMKRQAATVLALASRPDYLFFDETFDGLDPVMRQMVKQVIYEDVMERQMTTIITSHSLQELEDTCDQLALLHRGGIVFESDVQDLKTSLFKVQIAFDEPYSKEKFEGIDKLSYSQVGSVSGFVVRGDREWVEHRLRAMSPLLLDLLPLSLEEVFVHEMKALGYSVDDMVK
jgi:ABC-2 type transport system ATP-binding protein